MESPKADDGWQVSFVAPHLEVRCSGNGRGMFVRDRSVKKGQVLVVWSGVLLLVQLPSPEFKCSTKRTGGGVAGRIVSSAGLEGVPEEEHSYVMQLHDDIFMIPFEYGRREPAVRSHRPMRLLLLSSGRGGRGGPAGGDAECHSRGRAAVQDFVNHSCDPNSGLAGEAILVAMRDIAVGEVMDRPSFLLLL